MSDRYGPQIPAEPTIDERDGIYPSEVAKERPIAQTRVDCGGDDPHKESDSACDRFNHQLRDQPLRGERG